MSIDPIAAIRTVLLADPAVSALVDTRIWGAEVPTEPINEVKLMPRAGVVLNPSGGPGGEGYNEFGKQRIDTLCYGATLMEAWHVHLAVYAVLKQLRRQKAANVLLHSADPAAKGASGRDPVTQWPVTLSSWLVLCSEIAAA